MTPDDAKNTAKDIAEHASTASAKTTAAAKDAAEQGAGHVRDFAARAGEAAGDMYEQTHSRIKEAVERFPGTASEAVDAGRRMYGRSSETVGRRVSKQPLEALLLAGAIGYLVGWATNRG